MAHNSGFYQAEGQPQQPQYSPVFQQPQNIYQQLGKLQPQPHLQSHPTYTPQQQPIQSQGFQFSQQQYQPPYQLTPSPYSAPQTPYPPSQTPYVTSQTPFAPPQTPYQLSPTPYAPSQTPYSQPQPAPQYPIQQQPVYTPQNQISQVPTSSFPNQTPAPGAVPTSSSGSSWRLPSTRPPPVALSASLAQQAQSQAQVQAPPQPQPQAAPQTPGRRPLPQPTPGANAKPPALPPANSPQRIPTLPNVNTPASTATSKPFPKIQTGQAYVAPSSKTPSPTRSRPLPTPAGGGANTKRATVDLGKLPHGLSNIVPSLSSATGSSSSSGPDWLTQKRSTSPTKGVQPTMMSSFPERKTAEAVGLSKTSGYAITNSSQASSSNTSSVPPKRRASPPRFQSQPNSESSSPIKDNPPANNNNTLSAKLVPTSSSSVTANANSTNTTNPAPSSSTSTAAAAPPPKKFTPMWKRTIPEMPAPAWGYAAGMVSEPHPKPKPVIPASQTMPPPPVPLPPIAAPAPAQTKGKGKLKKKQAEPTAPSTNFSQYTQPNPTAQRSWQPYQQQQPQTAQYAQQAGYGARGHITQPQQAEEDDDEEEETEEDEEEDDDDGDEEEEEEEEEETEEDGSDYPTRYAAHTRQYSQPLASERPQAQSRGRYEYAADETTPKKPTSSSSSSSKKVLRPKTKPTPFPVDGRTRKMKSVDEGYVLVKAKEPEAKAKVRPKGRNRASDVDEERTPRKRITREGIALRKHERSQSAFEEREVVRHRREPGERRPGSAFTSGERRRRKDDSDDDEEGYATLAYLDSEEDEEEVREIVVWKKKTTPKKMVVRARGREEEDVDWDRRDVRNRRQASSPQHGIRDLPPSSRRTGSTPGTRYSDGYESDDYLPSRSVVSGKQQERQYRDDRDLGRHSEREPPRNRSAGLPQPPAMVREVAGGGNSKMRAAPRMKSTQPKYEEEYEEDDRRDTQESSSGPLHMRFTAMNINGDGNRSDSRGSSSSSVWPVDLPRLPRTPGSSTTPGAVSNHGGGYFDMRPQSMNSPTTNTNFPARQQPVRSQGEMMNKHTVMQNQQSRGMLNMNLSLDDPPPRATVIRTPSPGPSGYTLRRELPQPQGRAETTQSRVPENAAQQLQRRQSMYSAPPSAPDHRDGGGGGSGVRRPQSQAYSVSNAQMPSSSFGQAHPAGQQNRTRSEMSNNQLGHAAPFNNATRHHHQPQTPAPPPTVGIESPHPVGGRDRLADIPKLESDSNDGSDTEYRRRPRAKVPRIQPPAPPPSIPMINVNSSPNNNTGGNSNVPLINIDPPMIQIDGDSGGSQRQQRFENNHNNDNNVQVFEVPGVSVSGPDFDEHDLHGGGPGINISGPDDYAVVHRGQGQGQGHGQPQQQQQQHPSSQSHMGRPRPPGGGGLICGGCHGPIIGRIVSAMGSRYHPACFKCTVCNALLEHVSSYEHEGQPYCHLDYHEVSAFFFS
jgi:hypothetical protein